MANIEPNPDGQPLVQTLLEELEKLRSRCELAHMSNVEYAGSVVLHLCQHCFNCFAVGNSAVIKQLLDTNAAIVKLAQEVKDMRK